MPATDSLGEGSLEPRQAMSSASGLTLSFVPFPAPKEMISDWKAMGRELQMLVDQEGATSIPLCVTLTARNASTGGQRVSLRTEGGGHLRASCSESF